MVIISAPLNSSSFLHHLTLEIKSIKVRMTDRLLPYFRLCLEKDSDKCPEPANNVSKYSSLSC